jgi:2-polyprenyl-3-methyl-5-hydroxy-6-metoxy-1,4-benzoquinol methylase
MIEKISTSQIIYNYLKHYKIDVTKYFNNNKTIYVFECLNSGYRFFYPLSIFGDSEFYAKMQNFDWYYMPWKWEHQQASLLIKSEMSVLEIGCAEGEFLQKIHKNTGCKCTGIELNHYAAEIARSKGIEIFTETIEEFAKRGEGFYDYICSFQVLEHISNVFSFLEAQVRLLKKGGLLTISVPNNSSFISKSINYLNMPPHHMGLWNLNSLSNLTKIFPLDILAIDYEPLQKYHRKYLDGTNIKILQKFISYPAFLFWPVAPLFRPFLSKKFKASTIQITYKKHK